MLGFMFSTARALAAVQGQQTRRRLAVGAGLAGVLAVVVVVAVNAASQNPLCVLYTDADIMWWILRCMDW